MSDNREERITFRVDPETSRALTRYLERTKRKKSDAVHEALHRFLLEHDPQYRAEVSGTHVAEPSQVLYTDDPADSSFPLVAEPPAPPLSPTDAPPASPGDSFRRNVG